MRLYSWNVNGLRAAYRNGFLRWFEETNPDVVCLQETKARPEQLIDEMGESEAKKLIQPLGFHSYWTNAEKLGYSGVTIFSRKEPLSVSAGLKDSKFNTEGRVITADYGDFVLINTYFPNSRRDHSRLGDKLEFCVEILEHCESFRSQGKNIVMCGDYNIAHREIDLKNPKTNVNNAGFLPEEREWMEHFLNKVGYVDSFRKFNTDPGHYTWWSYRPGVREKNIGWRIDYFCSNPEFADRLKSAAHLPHIRGSDHCPVELILKA